MGERGGRDMGGGGGNGTWGEGGHKYSIETENTHVTVFLWGGGGNTIEKG
jgi:hypothetical protein